MEQSDLESYEYQLASVKQAYVNDPTNSELINLKEELENLISLTKEFLASQAAPVASSSKKAHTDSPRPSAPAPTASTSGSNKRKAPPASTSAAGIAAGDEVSAKYSGDGKWYSARVVSVGGSTENPLYSVIFKKYDSTELLGLGDVKALSVDKKRAIELSIEEAEREKKKKKYDKKQETRQQKNAEQNSKKASWQKFATKSTKKGVSIPGVSGTSQFASNATGRVGVVGSGKEMAAPTIKQKWQFEKGVEE